MKLPLVLILSLAAGPLFADPGNPAIDASQHLRIATQALSHRSERRVDEAEFLRLSRQPNAVILDARSADMYALLHVRGAMNLPFPDITIDSLASTLPSKDALILIYCNNNFQDEPRAFPTKLPSASLNLSTYAALYDYGYRNLYELAPVVDPATTLLPMEGILANK